MTVDPFWAGRRIALTGATGFVGWHLASLLHRLGASLTAVVRPTSRTERLRLLADRIVPCSFEPTSLAAAFHDCDGVIHAAGAVDFGDDWPRFREVNVTGTLAIVDAARAAGVRRLIHISSIVAVGYSQDGTPVDETASWNLGPFKVPYVTTKREGEQAALAANGRGLDVVAVNPGCVIGPDDFSASEFGALCRRFWRGQVPVCFSGSNNFVDVRDVADGTLRAFRFGRSGERYLLTGENRRLSAFFGELARVSPRSHPRLTLPAFLAPPLAAMGQRFLKSKKGRRPLLTVSQARVLGLPFAFTAAKAARELGFQTRPLAITIRETHAFWMPARTAA